MKVEYLGSESAHRMAKIGMNSGANQLLIRLVFQCQSVALK